LVADEVSDADRVESAAATICTSLRVTLVVTTALGGAAFLLM
jgi:hypothetical protein